MRGGNLFPNTYMTIRFYFTLCAFFFSVAFISCEDPLPPYQKPENIFEAGYTSIDTFLVKFSGSIYYPQEFWYTESPPFAFVLQIENTYEETIQGTADIQGKLEIWLPGHREFMATLPLTNSNALMLNSRSVFDPATSNLTLNTHQKLYLKTEWKYKLDGGKWINEILENYVDRPDDRGFGYTYRYYAPTQLQARLTVGIIKNTSQVVADTVFVLNLRGLVDYP